MDCHSAPALCFPAQAESGLPRPSLRSAETSTPDIASSRVTPEIRSALLLLLDAAERAQDAGTDVWQFSVELSVLREIGLTKNECRWLVAQGLAEHACEHTTHNANRRTFQPYANLALPEGTCFVIAKRGAAYADVLLQSESPLPAVRVGTSWNPSPHATCGNGCLEYPCPTWDSDRQQLRLGRTVVKEFKVPAPNQQAVLSAFQEENWAPRIDDPLPPALNQDPKRRLHSTINCLNRNQRQPLLRFLGDGKGEGVRWEFAPEDPLRRLA
jgi:hypothetical protein